MVRLLLVPDRIRRETALLQRLHGHECTRAGNVDGGSLVLDFGTRYPTDVDEERAGVADFDADYWLAAQCPWRLDSSSAVIVGRFDTNNVIRSRAQVLVGRQLRATQVEPPGFTARLVFSGELTLWLFACDSTDFVPDDVAEPSALPWFTRGRMVLAD